MNLKKGPVSGRADDISVKNRFATACCALTALVFVAAACAGLSAGLSVQPSFFGGGYVEVKSGWKDSQGRLVQLPMQTSYGSGRCEYTAPLPEAPDSASSAVLYFTARYLNARLYLDGQLVGECFARPEGASSTQGTIPIIIELPDDYAGKELRLEAELLLGPGVSYKLPAPLIGERSSILYSILLSELPELLVGITVWCFSAILILFGVQRGPRRGGGTFLYTGLFAAGFELYSLCASRSIHLFLHNSYVIYLFEFLLLAFLPIPLVRVVMEKCDERFKKPVTAVYWLQFANFFAQAALHFFTPLELRQTVSLSHFSMVAAIIVILPSILLSLRHNRDALRMLVSFTPVILGATVDIVLFYLSYSYREAFGVQLGVLMFVLLQAYNLIRSYLEYYENTLQSSVYRKMAYKDALTGLGNRAAFEVKLEHLRNEVDNLASLWCVCADINNLKRVNDTMGHSVGDELIRGAADTLHEVMCEKCEVFRTGGDEFVMFVKDSDKAELEKGEARLLETIDAYNADHVAKLSIAIGYDSYRHGGGDSIDALLSRADTMMYEDKHRQKASRAVD